MKISKTKQIFFLSTKANYKFKNYSQKVVISFNKKIMLF